MDPITVAVAALVTGGAGVVATKLSPSRLAARCRAGLVDAGLGCERRGAHLEVGCFHLGRSVVLQRRLRVLAPSSIEAHVDVGGTKLPESAFLYSAELGTIASSASSRDRVLTRLTTESTLGGRLQESPTFVAAVMRLDEVVDRLHAVQLRTGGLLVHAFDGPGRDPAVIVDRVQRQLTAVGELADAFADALDLPRPETLCPACAEPLTAGAGDLLEDVCARCKGRLLPPAAVEQLFGLERGMTPGDLKDRLGEVQSLRCPRCRTLMGPVLIDENIYDLCAGCGSMWLDAGELDAASQGRFADSS